MWETRFIIEQRGRTDIPFLPNHVPEAQVWQGNCKTMTHHSQEADPHLPGPEPEAGGAEAVDDDLDGEGGVEVGLGHGRGVVVVQHLRQVAVLPAMQRGDFWQP